MLRRLLVPAFAFALFAGACADAPAGPSAAIDDDYALLMFGEAGVALEGTLGEQHQARPFDGRSGRPHFPELTEEQRAKIQALRAEFRAEHAELLDALREVFLRARRAHAAGASREEIRAILMTGHEIRRELHALVHELHLAILACLTDEQRAWLREHQPRRLPLPIAWP